MLNTFKKRPADVEYYRLGLYAWLDVGESIASASVLVQEPAGQVSAFPLYAVTEIGSTSVKVTLLQGTAGNTYSVYVRTLTSLGNLREDLIHVTIEQGGLNLPDAIGLYVDNSGVIYTDNAGVAYGYALS